MTKLPIRFLLALRFLEIFPRRNFGFSLNETKIAQILITRSNLEPFRLAVAPANPFFVQYACPTATPKQRSIHGHNSCLATSLCLAVLSASLASQTKRNI